MSDVVFGFSRGSEIGDGSSERQLRARHEALAELADRTRAGGGSGGAARRLVQIYSGGSMPTAPDHWFLAHPVELDGAEVESGSGTPVVDTTQTIPVLVIGSVPTVGDLLVAYAVGGRWVCSRGVGALPCDWFCQRPTVTFGASPDGGPLSTAAGRVIIAGGTITGVNITTAGYGYVSAPSVTFSPPQSGGTTATGTAVLGTGGNAGRVVSVTMTHVGAGYFDPGSAPPAAIHVTDPVYGSFTLPKISPCFYQLLTTLPFAGYGDCPAAAIPVCMSILDAGSPFGRVFLVSLNKALTGTDQTALAYDVAGHGCVAGPYGLTAEGWSLCPSDWTVDAVRGVCDLPSIPADEPRLLVGLSCTGTRPWSATGSGLLLADRYPSINSNPFYLLYGGPNPVVYDPVSWFCRGNFSLTWTFSE